MFITSCEPSQLTHESNADTREFPSVARLKPNAIRDFEVPLTVGQVQLTAEIDRKT